MDGARVIGLNAKLSNWDGGGGDGLVATVVWWM